LNRRVNFYPNPGLSEVFEQRRERLVFNGQPETILIEPEFAHVSPRKERQPPEGQNDYFV